MGNGASPFLDTPQILHPLQTAGRESYMAEWVPLLKSLVWPVFLATVLYFGRAYVKDILSAIRNRIEKGASIQVGPVSLGELRQQVDKKFWYLLGEVCRRQKEWEDAKYAFDEAIKLDSNYTSAYLGLACTLRDESKQAASDKERENLLNLALKNCDIAVDKEEHFAPAYMTRAAVKRALNYDLEKVKTDLKKAISLDPGIKKFIREENEFDVLRYHQWFQEITQ